MVDDPNFRNVRFFENGERLLLERWGLAPPEAYDAWESSPPDASMVCLVVCSDFGGLQRLAGWNALAYRRGWHFLPVVLQNAVGLVGPLVIPKETACFQCLLSREEANSPTVAVKRATEMFAFEGQLVAAYHPSMATALGDVAAVELTKHYAYGWPSAAIGNAIEVNLLAATTQPRHSQSSALRRLQSVANAHARRFLPRKHRAKVTATLLQNALDRLLDPRFGVITLLAERPYEPGSAVFPLLRQSDQHCRVGSRSELSLRRRHLFGAGPCDGKSDRGGDRAILFRVLFQGKPAVRKREGRFVSVRCACRFRLYREDQYAAWNGGNFVPFTNEVPVRWTRLRDVETSQAVYVPAAMVYMPYTYDLDVEPWIVQPISTGLACNEGLENVLVSAACEAIERDAFTIFWQARLGPPRVPRASLDETNRDLLDRFARARYDVTIFNITTDIGVPSAMAVACHDEPREPALCIAAASHPLANVAVRKCLEELEHTRKWCRRLQSDRPDRPTENDDILQQEHHLRFW